MYEDFCYKSGLGQPFPASRDFLLEFINYSHFAKNHCADTTLSLISILRKLHEFKFNTAHQFDDPIVKRVLLGIKNKEAVNPRPASPRLAFNYAALTKLGHIVAQLPWPPEDRNSIWAAYLLIFWGSFRQGEVISTYANKPSFHTLRWNCVRKLAGQDGYMIHILAPKKDIKGLSVPLVPYKDHRYCPIFWLEKIKPQICDPNSFVFVFQSGKFISTSLMSKILTQVSTDLGTNGKFTGHSLRAAIPSLLSSHPDSFSEREIRNTGRWKSDTYEVYCRTKAVGAKATASKIHEIYDVNKKF